MPTIEGFAEIIVIGVLALVAISPLFAAMSPSLQRRTPKLLPTSEVPEKGAAAAVLIALAFVLGIVCSRLADDVVLDAVGMDGKTWYADAYESWHDQRRLGEQSVVQHHRLLRPHQAAAAHARWATSDSGRRAHRSLKLFEMQRTTNEAVYGYLQRHKLFMRVLAAVAVLAPLFIACMLVYDVRARLNRWEHEEEPMASPRRGVTVEARDGGVLLLPAEVLTPRAAPAEAARPCRYPASLYLTAIALALICLATYRLESTHYYERVCELAAGADDCDLTITHAAPDGGWTGYTLKAPGSFEPFFTSSDDQIKPVVPTDTVLRVGLGLLTILLLRLVVMLPSPRSIRDAGVEAWHQWRHKPRRPFEGSTPDARTA